MKNFKQNTRIKEIIYKENEEDSEYYKLTAVYLDGSKDTCLQSSRQIADSLKNYGLSGHSLIIGSNDAVNKTYIKLIKYELIANDQIPPQYELTIRDNFQRLKGSVQKSAQDIFNEYGEVGLDKAGYLVFDSTQKRQIKSLQAIDIKYTHICNDEPYYKFTHQYDDGSSRQVQANSEYLLERYTGFFVNDQGMLQSDGSKPAKLAKEKKEILSVNVDWRYCMKVIPPLFKVDINYADQTSESRSLTSLAIQKKYQHYLRNTFFSGRPSNDDQIELSDENNHTFS